MTVYVAPPACIARAASNLLHCHHGWPPADVPLALAAASPARVRSGLHDGRALGSGAALPHERIQPLLRHEVIEQLAHFLSDRARLAVARCPHNYLGQVVVLGTYVASLPQESGPVASDMRCGRRTRTKMLSVMTQTGNRYCAHPGNGGVRSSTKPQT